MRLFYIIVFFLAIFAVNISQKRAELPGDGLTSFAVSSKNLFPVKVVSDQNDESLQKDFISQSSNKISTISLLLLPILLLLLPRNPFVCRKVVIKRLNYYYWCLFKMLYPKHVFW